MKETLDLPSYETGYLADFVGDLRTWVFKRKTEAAQYFHLHHATIGRYEKSDHGGLKPRLGYLACLAVKLVDVQKEDMTSSQTHREHLLKEINKVIRAEYFLDEVPFKNWKGLVMAAEAYMQERQNVPLAAAGKPEEQSQLLPPFLRKTLLGSIEGLEAVLKAESAKGPVPSWPRVLVALLHKALGNWSIIRMAKSIPWILVWLLAWALIAPSLRWPFSGQEQALAALGIYAGGTLILPLLIGALTDTKDNEFWRQQHLAQALMTRLYTYQGAWIGFLLGYFAISLTSLVGYYVHLHMGIWFELILAAIPLITGYAGARLVPYNLWLAYGRLNLADGGIFFVFPILGPAWGLFLLWSHEYLANPLLGTTILLTAITISVMLMARQYERTGTTIIPVYLWVILYGVILILYEIGRGGSLYSNVSLIGLILTFAILLAFNRIHLTLQGVLALLAGAGILLVTFPYSLWAGGLLGSLMILVWSRWGRAHIFLPLSFWGVVLVDIGMAGGLREGWWPQVWASAIYGVIALVILWLEYRQRRAKQSVDS